MGNLVVNQAAERCNITCRYGPLIYHAIKNVKILREIVMARLSIKC